ncbi:MAG: tRNA (adenosine(37)-N6)-dimethylallyltransferase MiaA [Clostridia bacterium]|nr:tRNA (adenosine(37)-N6)-dimethylallyltransferase MiaA [Clostridia bacterium]
MNGKTKVIAVVGPTASGKTALSVELAVRYGGEIISCDSMQIYRGMDIGTAKVTETERRGVAHHLVDVVSAEDSFSCADYARLAKMAVEDISSRGKIPIFCGGTGLYLDSVLKNTEFSAAGKDDEFRERLENGYSPSELHCMLAEIDRESAESIHENNVKRVIRALEIFHVTGRKKSEWDALSRTAESPYDSIVIGLDYRSREELYRRIDLRVDIMMGSGLTEEVRALDSAAFRASTASQAIGYKEILSYLDGKTDLQTAVEQIKQFSRNYAKRQLTWFGRNKEIKWIYPDCAPRGADVFGYVVSQAEEIIGKVR